MTPTDIGVPHGATRILVGGVSTFVVVALPAIFLDWQYLAGIAAGVVWVLILLWVNES